MNINYYGIKAFDETGLVKTIYTTKEISAWAYNRDNSVETYEALALQLGIRVTDMVRTNQTHTAKVRVASKEDGGELILRPESAEDALGNDGLITNLPGLLLCTLEADCVPVYLLDPVQKVIAMIHSGWRGTAGKISVNGVKAMEEHFGSKAENIMAAMGPCISGSCYEVSDDLRDSFAVNFKEEELLKFFIPASAPSKYYLDLPKAIRLSLTARGLKEENIFDPDYCTYSSEQFPSYRRDKENAGRMLTAIMLL